MAREFKFDANIKIVDDNVDSSLITLSWQLDGCPNIYLWVRRNGDIWKRVLPPQPPPITDDDGNPILILTKLDWDNTGTRSFVGELGVFEAVAFTSEDDNPNDDEPLTDPPPLGVDRCLILTRNKTTLNDDRFFPKASGTAVKVETRKDPPLPSQFADVRSFAIFQVDPSEPIQDVNKPDGLLEFATRPMLTKVDNYNLAHEIEIADRLLFPGNKFFGLLTLVDVYGQWQCFKFPFQTLRRKVVVMFDEIHIINDGSDGESDAAFYVWLTEGWLWAGPNSIYIPELPISDRPGTETGKENIKLIGPRRFAGPITLGPSVIVPEQDADAPNFNPAIGNEKVAALAYGIADGGILGGHDRAANFIPSHVLNGIRPRPKFIDGFLEFPVGLREERVIGESFEFRCTPDTVDNEFEFSLRGTFSVTYEP